MAVKSDKTKQCRSDTKMVSGVQGWGAACVGAALVIALGQDDQRTPDARDKGLGRQLLRFAVEQAREQGFPAVQLLLLKGAFAAAMHMYASEGFTIYEHYQSPPECGSYVWCWFEKRFDGGETKVQGELFDLFTLSMPWKDVPQPWAWPGRAESFEAAVESMT